MALSGRPERTTADDLDAIDEGQRRVLQLERDALALALDHGQAPVVCLSAPGQPRRMVKITSHADLASRKLPWANLP